MHRLKNVLFLWMLCLMPTMAQVDMRVGYKRVSQELIDIVFSADIQRGWHVYGTNIDEGGPTRAAFNIDSSEGVEPVGKLRGGPGAIAGYDETFAMNVSWYEGRAQFTQRVRLTSPTYKLNGYLEWGACNDQTCLPPQSTDCSLSGTDGPAATPEDKPVAAEEAPAEA